MITFNKIRNQFLFPTLLVVVAGIAYMGWTFFHETEAAVIQNALLSMHAEMQKRIDVARGFHDKAVSDLLMAVEHPAFQAYFSLEETRRGNTFQERNGKRVISFTDRQRQTKKLLESWTLMMQKRFPIVESCLIDRSGQEHLRISQGTVASDTEFSSMEQGAPFFAPTLSLSAGQAHVNYPYMSVDGGQWVFSYTAPIVLEDGTKPAFYHYELPVALFQSLVITGHQGTTSASEAVGGGDGWWLLVDDQGRVLADSRRTIDLRKKPGAGTDLPLKAYLPEAREVLAGTSGVESLLASIRAGLSGSGHFLRDGGVHHAVFAPIMPEFHWNIVYIKPYSTLLIGNRTLDELRGRILFSGAAMILVASLLILWVSDRVVGSLRQVIHTLSSFSAQLGVSLHAQEQVIARQAASVQETNATMEELGASARQSAERADAAATGAEQALALSRSGLSQVEETMDSMEQAKATVDSIAQQILLLTEKNEQIREIAGLVSDFANETRMLAMNAAVEAVRAGEYGKGFAVLAMETRKLADESKRSVARINVLIGDVQRANNGAVLSIEEGNKTVDRGIDISRNTAENFRDVAHAVEAASQGAQQISRIVGQQSVAIRQVVEAMQSVNAGARESMAGMQLIKEGIRTLDAAAQALEKMV